MKKSTLGILLSAASEWFQTEVGDDIETLGQVEYRDVAIIGPGNERLGVFNFTVHDLADTVNYAALEVQLLDAATQ